MQECPPGFQEQKKQHNDTLSYFTCVPCQGNFLNNFLCCTLTSVSVLFGLDQVLAPRCAQDCSSVTSKQFKSYGDAQQSMVTWKCRSKEATTSSRNWKGVSVASKSFGEFSKSRAPFPSCRLVSSRVSGTLPGNRERHIPLGARISTTSKCRLMMFLQSNCLNSKFLNFLTGTR
jgi:hypothetical protein